jgi:polar amino acid transport system substrate-binding protein
VVRNDNALMNRAALALSTLLVASCAMTPTVSPSLRSEFAPSGTLRAGVNFGNIVIAQKDAAGGEPRGVGPELARELARRLGVPIAYVTYDTAGKMADGVKVGAWDVAFLAVDPARATDIGFSAPYVQIEGTYLVKKASPLAKLEDFDRKGLRIAVGRGAAYDLYLTRALKNAELVRVETSQVAMDELAAGRVDAAAGVKNALAVAASKDPGLRVLDTSFMVIGQAAGVPRARENAANYLRSFIEEAKATGFVANALKKSGVADATVAPASSPR